MHKILEELNVCPDCGGVDICYHFLKCHYCPGDCGKTMHQRVLEEEALGNHGLPIEVLTPEQESDQWDFTGEATAEDWYWVDAFNGRPRGYTKQWTLEAELAGVPRVNTVQRRVETERYRVKDVVRVEAPPLEIDWTTPGNAILWAWVLAKGLDKPLGDARSVYHFKGGDIEVVYPWRVLFSKGFNCGICGGLISLDAPRNEPLGLVFDHIIPVSKGGSHSYSNIQPAHFSCNGQKGAKVDGWQDIKPMVKVEVEP